ncbi:hypothetical protein [Saccharicrinis fermentans]|uniref:MutS domain III n=1 Tax=Saccharicrinis fermentans DSM 9555 = JCM 21142 TaxID=869213 RepID=W7Y4A9_9BACT|nr:hypothetical protein [Saccharicrinis fermentans]GAF02922.1 MutS domain III [Saccharicrinis fermentans DSM 9555 = JCM 21142]
MEETGGIQQGYIDLKQLYSERALYFTRQVKIVSTRLIRGGWLRLLFFVLLFAAPLYVLNYSAIAAVLLFVGFAVTFGILVKRSIAYRKLKAELVLLKMLNENEEKVLEGDFSSFDSGSEFIDPQHDYSHDLDLFGEGSFFQYINRTSTLVGTCTLKNKLCAPHTDLERIVGEQKAIKELSEKIDFRQHFFAKGKMLNETKNDIDRINSFKTYKPFVKSKGRLFGSLLIAMPILFLCAVIFSFWELPSAVPVIIFLINLLLVGLNLKEINRINGQFSSLTGILQKYALLINLIAKENFSTIKLSDLQTRLLAENTEAAQIIATLSKYMSQFDQRNSMLMGVVLNGCLLWDYRYVNKIELWLEKYGGILTSG